MVEAVLGETIEPSLPLIFDTELAVDAANWIPLTDEADELYVRFLVYSNQGYLDAYLDSDLWSTNF